MKAILAICVLATSFAAAQPLEFEVATIKPFQLGGGPAGMGLGPSIHDGFFHARTSLLQLIASAYGVGQPQIQGSSWLNDDAFEILAKVPVGIPNSDFRKPSDANMEKMLQALLKNRFSLATHTEMKETDVYDLVMAKGGIKMTRYPEHTDRPPNPPNARGAAQMGGTSSMAGLAMQLTMFTNRPILDKTGIEGVYNYFLYFMPVSPTRAAEIDAPILTDAIQQQLGLKLQPAKEPMPVIVVDHIEKNPTEN